MSLSIRSHFRLRWVEKELGVSVGNSFVNYLLHALTVAPPTPRIVIRAWDCNDADTDIWSKSFSKQQTSASSVGAFGHDVEAAHLYTMLAQPISQRNRRAVGPVPTADMRGNHLD